MRGRAVGSAWRSARRPALAQRSGRWSGGLIQQSEEDELLLPRLHEHGWTGLTARAGAGGALHGDHAVERVDGVGRGAGALQERELGRLSKTTPSGSSATIF